MHFSLNKSSMLFSAVLSASVLLTGLSPAHAEKLLPENEFQEFLKNTKKSPGNIAKDQTLIRKLSNQQLFTLVESFNVGHYGFLHPMKIKGEKFPDLLGHKFENLSVMAVWDGILKPIPFQFDEYDKKSGYIYIPKVNKEKVDGTYLELDPNDELIFMFRDAGEKPYQEKTMALKEGKILREILINDIDGNQRFAYLVEDNSTRSEADYISSDLENNKIVSSFYHIEHDPKNFLDFKDVRPYVGTAADQRVIDDLYFELSANIFNRFVKVGMNSADNVRIKVLGVKDGPVRSTALVKMRFIFGKIPLFSMNSEISFYEQGMVMPNRTEVGKGAVFAKVFKNAEILMYVDMNGIDGGKVSAQAFVDENGERLYGFVDGKMDEQELKAAEAGLPGDWTWIESGLGWDIFMAFSIPMEHLEGMSISVYYEDDKNSTTKFESFPGAGPKLGMKLIGMPTDMKALETLEMEYAFWFPDTVGKDGPEGFHKHEQNPPQATIKKF